MVCSSGGSARSRGNPAKSQRSQGALLEAPTEGLPTNMGLKSSRVVQSHSLSRTLKTLRVPKSEGYLNRSFLEVKKGGRKGEVKRGEVVGE